MIHENVIFFNGNTSKFQCCIRFKINHYSNPIFPKQLLLNTFPSYLLFGHFHVRLPNNINYGYTTYSN